MKVRVSLNVELCDFSDVMNAGSTFKDALFFYFFIVSSIFVYILFFEPYLKIRALCHLISKSVWCTQNVPGWQLFDIAPDM